MDSFPTAGTRCRERPIRARTRHAGQVSGEAIGDARTIEEGKDALDGELASFGTFTHFVRGITLLGRGHDDPVLDSAAEDMWAVSRCAATRSIAQNPTTLIQRGSSRLTDSDPSNDPELFAQSAHVCVGCHAD